MKKLVKRVVPAALALSLTAAPVMAYADEFIPGPGQRYDDATLKTLKDNVLEYDEIEMLVDEYNATLKNLRETYSDTRNDYKDVVKLKSQIHSSAGAISEAAGEMSSMASMFKDSLGYQSMLTPGAYAEMLYASEMMNVQSEQILLQADTVTVVTPEMLKLKMIDGTRAMLISGAQSAVIGYEQLLLGKETLTDAIELLKEVYKSTEAQASLGMATSTAVLTARQNLESAEASMIELDAKEVQIRSTLCKMLGWEYNASPEIRKAPGADLSRIDRMNPENDRQTAIANNFTLRYNQLNLEELTDGSVDRENMERTIREQTAEISASLVNLYNDVIQKRNEYQTSIAAFELEKTKMEAAERKLSVGSIGRLEYLQQENAYKTKEIAVRTAELNLFQAMETYDWALKGNLSLS